MRCLTICEPYATLIARGVKWCENRDWNTTHRGLLLIHAGSSRKWLDTIRADKRPPISELQFGKIVAAVNIIGCPNIHEVMASKYQWKYLQGHEHASGAYCWCWDRVAMLPEPIPFKGRQGLYSVQLSIRPEELKWTKIPPTTVT